LSVLFKNKEKTKINKLQKNLPKITVDNPHLISINESFPNKITAIIGKNIQISPE
jgi:hypothetical protein